MGNLSAVKKLAVLSLLGGSLVSGAASAATCVTGGSGEASLQDTLNNITVGGNSSVSAANDCLSDGSDSTWGVAGSGLSSATMIIELAGQATTNTFGVYDSSDSVKKVELFSGGASTGSQVVLSILLDGSVKINFIDSTVDFASNSFGFYLGTGKGTFYSDSYLNFDGMSDHMLAYQGTGDRIQIDGYAAGPWGPGEFILAWEDLPFGNYKYDGDFNDMVLMVESVQPVPVPAAVWLFGSGLLGLVGIARRKAV